MVVLVGGSRFECARHRDRCPEARKNSYQDRYRTARAPLVGAAAPGYQSNLSAMPPAAHRAALVSAAADASREVMQLRAHGFATKVISSPAQDILLPSPGGALAFILAHPAATTNIATLLERASAAGRASRRCTILLVAAGQANTDCSGKDIEQLQCQLPPSISAIACSSSEEATEFIISCSQRVAASSAPAGTFSADTLQHSQVAAADTAAHYLATLWSTDPHQILFLLASQPLSALACVDSEEALMRLCHESEGLLDPNLLVHAIQWLHQDEALAY